MSRNLQNGQDQTHYDYVVGSEIVKTRAYNEKCHKKNQTRQQNTEHFVDSEMPDHAHVVSENQVQHDDSRTGNQQKQKQISAVNIGRNP